MDVVVVFKNMFEEGIVSGGVDFLSHNKIIKIIKIIKNIIVSELDLVESTVYGIFERMLWVRDEHMKFFVLGNGPCTSAVPNTLQCRMENEF